jgi:hypothetical protein
MRMWRVAVLVNLALIAGLGIGYGAWGRRLAILEGEIAAARAQVAQLTRERDACFEGARAGEQLWEARGIVRAVYPRLLIVTHEEIPGLLPARTTGFRLADPAFPGRARAGDPVRFWLQGAADNTTLVKIEPW